MYYNMNLACQMETSNGLMLNISGYVERNTIYFLAIILEKETLKEGSDHEFQREGHQ